MIYFKEITGKFLPEQLKNFRFKYNSICFLFLKLLKSDEGHICSDELFISVFPQARLFRGQTYESLTIITKNYFFSSEF